jgi:hypothetical protein
MSCGWPATWEHDSVTAADDARRRALLRRGFALEYLTLGWNVAGIVVLGIAAVAARSVALAGFGLDSLIEIGASVVSCCYQRAAVLEGGRPARKRWALFVEHESVRDKNIEIP